MTTPRVRDLNEMLIDGTAAPAGWRAKAVVNDDNLTWIAWNERTREAVVTDPVREDLPALRALLGGELSDLRFVAVLDSHTHADHVSGAAALAHELGAPLVQHERSPSRRVHLRVSLDTALPTAAGPLRLLVTPGHTPETLTAIWGPFLFGNDTLMHGDTGRDDLPGGDPAAHWESLQKIKAAVTPAHLMLPGHDAEGGRVTSWARQLEINAGLQQDLDTFVADAGAYVGPSPKLLKESLYENFK